MVIANKIRLTSIIFAVILLILSFFYLLIGYQFALNEGFFDEGLTVYGATRILNGDMPYRDFWSLYAPGEFYLLAGIFKLFGASIVVERIATVAIEALFACFVYLLVKKFIFSYSALAVWMLTLAWLRVRMPYSRPMTTALLFFAIASLGMANFIFTKKLRWLVVSGVFTGITALFRQDIGFYLSISTFLTISALRYHEIYTHKKAWLLWIKKSFSAYIVYCLGVVLIIAPMIFYFISKAAVSNFVSSAIIFPIKVYPKVRYLSFPNMLIFYLPLLIFFIIIIYLTFYMKGNEIKLQKKWLILFCLFCGIFFFNYSRMRFDMRHLLPTMIPAIILLGFLASIIMDKFYVRYRQSLKLIINLVGLILLVVAIIPKAKVLFEHIQHPGPELKLSRARGCYDQMEFSIDQQAAIQYIQERTSFNEKIFVGNLRYDRIVMNDIMFYFLSERHSATVYHELHPGLVTTKDVQEKIIKDIKKSGVRYIVCWTGDGKNVEANESNKSSGITELEDFIQRNFKLIRKFKSYLILYRSSDFS